MGRTQRTLVQIALVLLAGFGTACQSRAAASAAPASSTTSTGVAPNAANTTVLLYANLGEADEKCVCGQMIRAVRAAAQKGVKVREVDTRDADAKAETAKRHEIMVSPAVLFLDSTDKETRRFEGESSDTLKALDSELDQLTKR